MVGDQDNKLASSKVGVSTIRNITMHSLMLCVLYQVAARYAIGQTLISRVLLASVVMGECCIIVTYYT